MRVPDYHFDSRDQAECMRLKRLVATIIPACLRPSNRRETHHHAARLGLLLGLPAWPRVSDRQAS